MFSRKFLPIFASFSLAMATGSLSAASLTEGLVAQYPMQDVAGDALPDVSGNGRDAFASNVEAVEGRGGRVLAFDGKTSKVFLPEDPVFEVTGDYGVSFWTRSPAGSTEGGPIYAQPDFRIGNFRGGLRISFANPKYPGTGYVDMFGPVINDGEWHHVVFSYRAADGEAVLFLDAQEVKRVTFAHRPEVSAPTTVGFSRRTHLLGELSDLRVYSRVLDLPDVGALYNAKLVP